MSRRRWLPAEAAGHAVRPDDEVQVDAEDGDEPQHHQTEALQGPSHFLASGGPHGIPPPLLLLLIRVTWSPEQDAEISRATESRRQPCGKELKRSGGFELHLQEN